MIRRLQACFLLLLCIHCIEGYNPYSYETFGEKENEERKSNQCKVVKASDCVYYTPGWYYDQKNRFCFLSDKKMCVQSGHRFNDCTECMQTCNAGVCIEQVPKRTRRSRTQKIGAWSG